MFIWSKNIGKSIKIDKPANQIKALEYINEAENYENNNNLNDALRYYEIAQDYLPTSSEIRVIYFSFSFFLYIYFSLFFSISFPYLFIYLFQ